MAERDHIQEQKLPLWRRIEAELAAEIMSGIHPAGALFPAEPDLVKRFGVNRLTVRQALNALQVAGHIRIERGRGTFVQAKLLPYGLGERVSFSENLLAAKRLPSRRLIQSREIEAPSEIAVALGLPGGDALVQISVVGDADGEPILYGLNHFPARRFRGLDEVFAVKGSLSAALAAMGVEHYRRRSTELIARMPSVQEARYLAQPRNWPIVETRSVDVDSEGEPIAYGITCFASDRIKFVLGS